MAWTFVDIFVNRSSSFFASIVLLTLLKPQDFGLLSIVSIFITIGNSLIDSGLSTALQRLKNISQIDYSTVFVSNIIISIFIYFFIFIIAPYISLFFDEPILTNILRVYCLGFVITSFRTVHGVKLSKELDFRKLTILCLPGNLVSIFFAVTLSYLGFGVWSLVVQYILNQILTTILFWFFSGWRPGFDFDFATFKTHFGFGYKLLLASQLNTIFENFYNVFIGKFYDLKLLGFYERASAFNSYPVSILSNIIQKITLSSLVYIKDDIQKLRKVYINILQMTFLISCFGFSAAFFLISPLINFFFGERWFPIVEIFQILTLSFFLYPIHTLSINVLTLAGRSDIFLKLEILKKVVLIICIFIGSFFGMKGLVWSNVFVSFISLILNISFSSKFVGTTLSIQLKCLFPSFFISAVTLFVFYFTNSILNFSEIINYFISMFVGIGFFLFFCEFFKISSYLEIKKIIIEKIFYVKCN